MNAIVKFWSPFVIDGGWMALGGSYYNYVREIPVGADYEIWVSFGGWDEKWVRDFFFFWVPLLYRPPIRWLSALGLIGLPDRPLHIISQKKAEIDHSSEGSKRSRTKWSRFQWPYRKWTCPL